MNPTEAAELIRDLREDRADQEVEERFRGQAALLVSLLAMLLAVATLGGDNVAEEMIDANIKASDLWAFYQAKNTRQAAYRLAAEQIELDLALAGGAVAPEVRRRLLGRRDSYLATAARYEDEPDPAAPGDARRGEGKRQLIAQAQSWEARRERAQAQDQSFDYSGILFQIAIVLASVAILAVSRPVLLASVVLGAAATLLMLNGFLLLVRLPS